MSPPPFRLTLPFTCGRATGRERGLTSGVTACSPGGHVDAGGRLRRPPLAGRDSARWLPLRFAAFSVDGFVRFLVHLPFAASLPDGRRMSTHHIGGARREDRVGAQDKHRLVREVAIQSLFVVEEVGPVL